MTYTTTELKQTGIYSITNLDTGKRYIGSAAASFKQRWAEHKSLLRKDKHHSKHLQSSWNKYTEFRFEFKILEFVSPEFCIQREQWWIDLYGSYLPKNGYNISPTAGNCLGVKRSEETRTKISKIVKQSPPMHWLGKFGGEHGRAKHYVFISPEGIKHEVHGLNDFCKKHGLFNSAMTYVAQGKRKQHKGWKLG